MKDSFLHFTILNVSYFCPCSWNYFSAVTSQRGMACIIKHTLQIKLSATFYFMLKLYLQYFSLWNLSFTKVLSQVLKKLKPIPPNVSGQINYFLLSDSLSCGGFCWWRKICRVKLNLFFALCFVLNICDIF